MYTVHIMNKRFNGKAIAVARKNAGMDQAALARAVGRHRVTISDVETGKLRPRRELAGKLADVLSLDLESLYIDTEAPPSTGAAGLTAEERQVIEIMRGCNEMQRAKIWAFAMGMAGGAGPAGSGSPPQASGSNGQAESA